MSLITLYIATAVIFFALDFIGLRFLIRPVFEQHIDDMLADSPNLGAAAVFYAFYVAGLLYFVSWPNREGPLLTVFLVGALFGALAYGTYEFTNFATLRDWDIRMVATDMIWGTLLTGVAAAGGVWLARAFA